MAEEKKATTKEESTAKKTAEAQATPSKNKKYKLADPNTSYSERDFTLAGDQEKELPEDPSSTLIARIQSGFIVEV